MWFTRHLFQSGWEDFHSAGTPGALRQDQGARGESTSTCSSSLRSPQPGLWQRDCGKRVGEFDDRSRQGPDERAERRRQAPRDGRAPASRAHRGGPESRGGAPARRRRPLAADPALARPPRRRRRARRRRHPEPRRPLARGEARRARAGDRDRLHRLLRSRRPGGRPHGSDARDAGRRPSRARTGVARAGRGPSRRLSPHRAARGLASRPPARRPDERRRSEGVRLLDAGLRDRRVLPERPLPGALRHDRPRSPAGRALRRRSALAPHTALPHRDEPRDDRRLVHPGADAHVRS